MTLRAWIVEAREFGGQRRTYGRADVCGLTRVAVADLRAGVPDLDGAPRIGPMKHVHKVINATQRNSIQHLGLSHSGGDEHNRRMYLQVACRACNRRALSST